MTNTATISLRVGTPQWMHPTRFDELLALLRAHRETLDEVAFFTGITHTPLPQHEIAPRAARLQQVIAEVTALGIAAGINHLSTIGHLNENLPYALQEPWQHLVDLDGAVSRGCYCPADPDVQAYIRHCYVAWASARPAFIWVDDDVRLESHPPDVRYACFCPRCLEIFAAETGRAWTRDALREALNGGTRDARLAVRRQWLEHNRRTIATLLQHIRTAVDTVDPHIPLGFMSSTIDYSGQHDPAWAAALAGTRHLAVKWRPGGGFYHDAVPLDLLTKMHATGRQVGLLPEAITDIQYEHENFPYQRLGKSERIFTTEIAAAVGAGCTGVALNVFATTHDPLEEFWPLFAAVRTREAFYDRAVSLFARTACEGMWPVYTPDHFAGQCSEGDWAAAQGWGADLAAVNELTHLGLPLAYTAAGAAMVIASGESVLDLSPAHWRALLAGGVLLDGPALLHLHDMGLGELTGFTVAGSRLEDIRERLTPHPLNGRFAGWHRDCRPSFYAEPTYLLHPHSADAAVLAVAQDFADVTLGAVAGVYENALGGRVGVLGYYPWRSVGTLAKSAQLRALCRWISGDRLPAYVGSLHRVAIWSRRDAQGRPALLLVNCSLDNIHDVLLQVRHAGALQMLREDLSTTLLAPEADDGPYRRHTLDRLAAWEPVLLASV